MITKKEESSVHEENLYEWSWEVLSQFTAYFGKESSKESPAEEQNTGFEDHDLIQLAGKHNVVIVRSAEELVESAIWEAVCGISGLSVTAQSSFRKSKVSGITKTVSQSAPPAAAPLDKLDEGEDCESSEEVLESGVVEEGVSEELQSFGLPCQFGKKRQPMSKKARNRFYGAKTCQSERTTKEIEETGECEETQMDESFENFWLHHGEVLQLKAWMASYGEYMDDSNRGSCFRKVEEYSFEPYETFVSSIFQKWVEVLPSLDFGDTESWDSLWNSFCSQLETVADKVWHSEHSEQPEKLDENAENPPSATSTDNQECHNNTIIDGNKEYSTVAKQRRKRKRHLAKLRKLLPRYDLVLDPAGDVKLAGAEIHFATETNCNLNTPSTSFDAEEAFLNHAVEEGSEEEDSCMKEPSMATFADSQDMFEVKTYAKKLKPLDLKKASLRKYWVQRYRLFSKFNKGILMDQEGWFSVTPERISEHIAERCKDYDIIFDGFCGVGGNAIAFARHSRFVIAADIDPVKIACAKHNAHIYGVAHKVLFLCGDILNILKSLVGSLTPDVVFLSPPWGGPAYLTQESFDLNQMPPTKPQTLFNLIRKFTKNIVLFVPRNTVVDQLIALGLDGECVEIEQNYLNLKLKTITTYYGNVAEKSWDFTNGN